MNKKQLIVCWVIGLLLSFSFIYSAISLKYISPCKASSFDGIPLNPFFKQHPLDLLSCDTKRWYWKTEFFAGTIMGKLTMTIPPILIVGGLLIYSFKNKHE